MGTFLINSEKSPIKGSGGSIGFMAAGDAPSPSQILDLETFTHCAPVLISEDEPQIARLYEVLLARMHLRSVSIPKSSAALDYMLKRPVSLVISNLMKPNVTGLDLLKALRQDTTTTDIPFMIITSTPDYETRLAFQTLGGNAYLTKPINTKQFTDTVVQLLVSQLISEPA
jgi:DNA-binding response OmpR family regulator